ncbi:hypothetical protein [Pengzhenrongella sp.]|uniref:hypothetical protein n=1 Tax=Pengzhenrongella sp. TaxID=2888820 RepID=UPI002F91DAAC
MMTTRATENLPGEWAGPILDLVKLASSAAASSVDDAEAWAVAEAGQARFRTGYVAARRTASAGQIAAHVLRLRAADHIDQIAAHLLRLQAADRVDQGAAHVLRQRAADRVDQGDVEDWTVALSKVGPAISSWEWDVRMQGALDLFTTYKAMPDDPGYARPARLVSAWLRHNVGAQLVPATGRLVEYVLEHEDVAQPALARAWYATHGARLLDELAARGKPREGRPTKEDAAHHALVRIAVCGVHGARIMTKRDLADRSGITRMTIDTWLKAEITAAAADQAPDGRHPHAVSALNNGAATSTQGEQLVDPEES